MENPMQYKHRRYTAVTMVACLLAASWFTMQVHAEDKQNTNAVQPKKTVNVNHKPKKHLFYPALTEREETLQAALQSDTEANFPDIPLNEVTIYFSHLHNVPISVQTKDLADIGVSADQTIDVSYSKISLKNALLQILDPLELTYIVDREMILITSKTKASEMLKTRVYPVADFMTNSPYSFDTLVAAIRNTSPGEWKPYSLEVPTPARVVFNKAAKGRPAQSQGGSISTIPQSNALVISQSYHAHNAIVELLTQLRQVRADQAKSPAPAL